MKRGERCGGTFPGKTYDTQRCHRYSCRRLVPKRRPQLSSRAKAFIDEAAKRRIPVLVSPISLIEIIYLQEKGKIPLGTLTRLEEALRSQDAILRVADLTMEVALAVGRVSRDEVPDMPNRVIAGTALHFGVPVISRDGKIKTSAVSTIW